MNNIEDNRMDNTIQELGTSDRNISGADARAVSARVDALAEMVSRLVGQIDKLNDRVTGGKTDTSSSSAGVALELGSAKSDWSEEVEEEYEKKSLEQVEVSSGDIVEKVAVASTESSVVGSVVMPSGGPSGAVAMPVFGQSEVAWDADKRGGLATYVKVDVVKSMRNKLAAAGIEVPRKYMAELAMVRYAAGSMPSWFTEGKKRLRVLASLGDSMFDAVVASSVYAAGGSAEMVQEHRARLCNDKYLSTAAVKAGLMEYLVVPTGVDPVMSKAGATFVEALAGVLFLRAGFSAVVKLAALLQIVDGAAVTAVAARW